MAVTHFMSSLDDVGAQYDLERQNPETLEQALSMAKSREVYFSDTVYNEPVNSDCFDEYSRHSTFQHGFAHYQNDMGNSGPIPQ